MIEWTQMKDEFRPMLRLAGPLVLGELGWMSMGVVDTMMVGRVSAEAIGGVSIGSIVFYTVAIFGMGLLLGLDTLVSQAYGAGRLDDCHRSLLNSVYLCVPLAAALMGVVWMCVPLLRNFGIQPAVVHEAIPYLRAILWATFPLLLYAAFRRYLQGMNLVKPVMFALISANLINLFGNWVLIYGHLGAPPMGAVGSGWATCISRFYLAAVLLGYIVYHEHRWNIGLRQTELRPDLRRVRRLLGLGVPAAVQMTLEIGVWATAAALAGRLDTISLAAHQIVMNCVSVTYMVPLGVSSAAAVRVGQALGRRDLDAANRSGWTAFLLGSAFMSCAALAFLLVPQAIMRVYTPNVQVIRMGVSLLFIAAFFQLFDGLQVVATGALRGAGDTRTPMFTHAIFYWLVGLPLGYFLAFDKGWGARGLWAGLSLALILMGIVLLWAWRRKVQLFSAEAFAAGHD